MDSQVPMEVLKDALLDAVADGISTWKKKKTPGAGGHRTTGSTSFSAIAATFVPTFTTAVLFLVIFAALRRPYRNIYAPRTFMSVVPDRDQTPAPSWKSLAWIRDFWAIDDKFVLRHQSLDGFLFLRFFKTVCLICFFGCCLTWPILIPVNATGGGDASQLDRISFSNINGSKRLYAHTVVAWLFLGFAMAVIARERLFVIGLRQAHLLSKQNAARLSSKVVLFLSVPQEALREDSLHRIFGGEAKRSWPVSNLDDLEKAVQDRNAKATALETAEVELSRNANKKRLRSPDKSMSRSASGDSNHSDGQPLVEAARPRHRSMPVIGDKVDTIQDLRRVLPEMASEVEKLREPLKNRDPDHRSALFVEFNTQAAAQQAYQHVHYHNPLRMQPRYIGVQPKEVLWKNLTLHPSDRIVRGYLAIAFITATIILWSIPIGFIAAISNINSLTDKVHFLRFINKLPKPVLGFITGFIPPYVMSTFVSYVPKFFRYVAKLSGEPTVPEAELRTQTWYFAFQIIQVFLVTTFSSGAAAVATKIANQPKMIPTLLAKNLPKAANFYLSYFILQGTASAAKNLLNYSDLLTYLGYKKFIDKTPRQQYSRFTSMKGISWGSVYPKFANMAVIALAYSCIAPLVLGFATIGLFLYYLSYRYNLIYVIQTKVDTKGEAYARALQHLLAGVYLSELCLIGLFGAREATGPSVLMIILLIFTILSHITFNRIIEPLERCLPTDLLAEDEESPLIADEAGSTTQEDESHQPTESNIQRFLRGKIHPVVLEPLARFLEPHIFFTAHSLQSWFRDPSHSDSDEEDGPTYTDDELRTAYLNPALTSKTPKLWLIRDEMGISRHEIEENEAVGIAATDEGATLDARNHIRWNHEDLTEVPIFKRPVRY